MQAQLTAGSFRVYDGRAISVGGSGRQCPAPRRQPPNLEALFAVPDRFWAGQKFCDPGMMFFSVLHLKGDLRPLLRLGCSYTSLHAPAGLLTGGSVPLMGGLGHFPHGKSVSVHAWSGKTSNKP